MSDLNQTASGQNCHRTTTEKAEKEIKNNLPRENESVEPLPESERPRKDGPGGD